MARKAITTHKEEVVQNQQEINTIKQKKNHYDVK